MFYAIKGSFKSAKFEIQKICRIKILLQVNVIAFNNTAYVPDSCHGRLFIANQRNLDTIRSFVSSFNTLNTGEVHTMLHLLLMIII